jgi:hypothetical protein
MEAASDDEWEQIAREELEWRKAEEYWEWLAEIREQLKERDEQV